MALSMIIIPFGKETMFRIELNEFFLDILLHFYVGIIILWFSNMFKFETNQFEHGMKKIVEKGELGSIDLHFIGNKYQMNDFNGRKIRKKRMS